MDDIYTYVTDLPPGVHEMVAPCITGFTVYLNSKDSFESRRKHYWHALRHIRCRDHERSDVNEIEIYAHKIKGESDG